MGRPSDRLARVAMPLVALAMLVAGARFLVGDSAAELENLVFTSRGERLRMVVPRGWRATDQPSYPGLLLWMSRQPPGQIVLTSETFTRALYCSWPTSCRSTQDSMTGRYACALRTKLSAQGLRVGPVQPGPKDNTVAGLPSVWFEYDDGKRFLRQAVAMSSERAVSLVLSAPSAEARGAHTRAFDQALRTLRLLTAVEAAPVGADAAVALVVDAAPGDATTLPLDGAPLDAGVQFESAPAPKIDPVGPCP